MMTVSEGGDESLLEGSLPCPNCEEVLRPWGFARMRLIRVGGRQSWVRPRRARCRACGRTQVLLPCRLLERRRDAASDVGTVLTAYAEGRGYRRAARDLAIPVPTVRNWVRRLRGRWQHMVEGLDPVPSDPAVGVLGIPREVIATLLREAERAGWSAAPWELASLRTNGGLLGTNTT